MILDLSLYFVIGGKEYSDKEKIEITKQAIKGGVTIVQLREKNLDTAPFLTLAKEMRKLCHDNNITFIINDRIDIALACNADGVHVGWDDMPALDARNLIGQNKILGLSIMNKKQLECAKDLPIDYIGIGPVYPTNTKNVTEITGIENLKKIVEKSKYPSVAIGGINMSNLDEVLSTGVGGVAVVSAILNSNDPCMIAKNLKEKISAKKI